MPKGTLRKTILREAGKDDVGLWLVVRWVRKTLAASDEAALRRKTLDLLGEMLREGLLQAGHPDAERRAFAAWPLSAEEAIARIEREWCALARAPRLGEVVWFSATKRGEREARRHATVHRRHGTSSIGDHSSAE